MFAAALLLSAALGSSTIAALQLPLLCKSQSQPNPIASIYPDQVTGTVNGTLSVLPIPLTDAQQIVGPKYAILTAAYRELLPDFPHDMYPAIIQAVHDHDLQAPGVRIPDFTVRAQRPNPRPPSDPRSSVSPSSIPSWISSTTHTAPSAWPSTKP